jgi:hypothetical protein
MLQKQQRIADEAGFARGDYARLDGQPLRIPHPPEL